VIKVLIADDHAVVRRGLRQILTEAGDIHVAGEATTANETLQLVQRERWDVIVLDVSLQGGNGIELLREMKAENPSICVLILTVHSEDQYAVRAIRAGAAGFLNKDSAPERLVEAVRRLAAGGRYVSPEAAEKLASFVSSDKKEPHELLSNREFEILKLIGSGRTVSQIATELSLSVKTISTHRTRILKKMEMSTNAELTTYAVRKSLV
jgi:two-component system, NarL family, invasion response regulator UvrY